jgi:hypothetical protein
MGRLKAGWSIQRANAQPRAVSPSPKANGWRWWDESGARGYVFTARQYFGA